MSANGVFFYVLVFLVVLQTPCQARVDLVLDGELEWVEPLVPHLTWSFDVNLSDSHCLRGNLVSHPQRTLEQMHFNTVSSKGVWNVYYNGPHITSEDIFRIVHKNSYGPHSLVLSFNHAKEAFLAFLGDRLVTQEDLEARVLLLQAEKQVSDIDFHLSTLLFDSPPQWVEFANGWDFFEHKGGFGVIEGSYKLASGELKFAGALNYDFRDQQGIAKSLWDRAFVVELSGKRGRLDSSISLISIGENFESPLARYRSYPPGRRGIRGKMTWQADDLRINYSLQAYRQASSDRLTSESTLKWGLLETKIRWLPSPQLRMDINWENSSIQWVVDDNRIRLEHFLGDHRFTAGGRFFGPYRLEWRYQKQHEVGLIWKINPSTNEQYRHALIRLGDEERWVELGYGTYDRRNIDAHFQTEPTFRLSWGYRF